MSKVKASKKLIPFDAARYLTDDAAVAEYISIVLETGDSDHLLLALSDIARARDMIRIRKDRRPIRLAERYGLSQEFSEEACPRGRG